MTTYPNAWGVAFFADDFRQEIFGKYTLVGIYNSDIIYPEGQPFAFPRLAILVRYNERHERFRGDVSVRVFYNYGLREDLLHESTLPREQVKDLKPYPPHGTADDLAEFITFNIPIAFTTIRFPEPGVIRVVVECDGQTTSVGRVVLRRLAPGEAMAGAEPLPFSR